MDAVKDDEVQANYILDEIQKLETLTKRPPHTVRLPVFPISVKVNTLKVHKIVIYVLEIFECRMLCPRA